MQPLPPANQAGSLRSQGRRGRNCRHLVRPPRKEARLCFADPHPASKLHPRQPNCRSGARNLRQRQVWPFLPAPSGARSNPGRKRARGWSMMQHRHADARQKPPLRHNLRPLPSPPANTRGPCPTRLVNGAAAGAMPSGAAAWFSTLLPRFAPPARGIHLLRPHRNLLGTIASPNFRRFSAI